MLVSTGATIHATSFLEALVVVLGKREENSLEQCMRLKFEFIKSTIECADEDFRTSCNGMVHYQAFKACKFDRVTWDHNNKIDFNNELRRDRAIYKKAQAQLEALALFLVNRSY